MVSGEQNKTGNAKRGTPKTKGAKQRGTCLLLHGGNRQLAEVMDGEEGVQGLELAGEPGKG